MCVSFLPVTLCFILYKGSNKYLATCQEQFFWYLHIKVYVHIGMVFILHGQGHFGFYDKEGGQEEEQEEEKQIQFRRSNAHL